MQTPTLSSGDGMRISGDRNDHGYVDRIDIEHIVFFNGVDISDCCITADEESCYVKIEAQKKDGYPIVKNGNIFTIDAFGEVVIVEETVTPSRGDKFWHFINKANKW